MSQIPLHVIISHLSRMNLDDQVSLLVDLVKVERPYSVRRKELLSLLQEKKTKQIKRNTRRAQHAA